MPPLCLPQRRLFYRCTARAPAAAWEGTTVLYWADQLIAELEADEVVLNDSKTYSGSAHVGSLRGPVIHDVLYRAALDAGRPARFFYGSDDYDALDAVPPSLSPELYGPYLGKPLCHVPAPDGSDRSYAEFFYDEFMSVQHELGIFPQSYRMSDLYRSGRMNGVIRAVLENAAAVREIYLEVSKSERPDDWLPFSVICENCGRIAMTRVTRFDGEKVYYRCDPDAMPYARGCGHEGAVSPFDGSGKLPWKLEWAARWSVLGVTVEGAGMDHSVDGGSRDVAEAIARRVFHREPPANVPYEFLLMDSRKMSSSKGIGFTARVVADATPPELLRYLLVRTRPRTAVNFRLDDEAMPRLYDEYDAAAEQYFRDDAEAGEEWSKRLFELAQIAHVRQLEPRYRPRFMHVVTVSQIPGIDAMRHFEAHKGAPLTAAEAAGIQDRIAYARLWLRRFAPEGAAFELRQQYPPEAAALSGAQRTFLARFAEWFGAQTALTGEQMHKGVYEIAAVTDLKAGQAFQALYLIFLGRTSGPRIGELLAALDPAFVARRLRQAQAAQHLAGAVYRVAARSRSASYGGLLTVDPDVFGRFPDLRIGVAVVRGARAHAAHPELDALKDKLAAETLSRYQGVNLGALERIKAYREIYRAFGVDPGARSSSVEALLRRAARGKGLPAVNVIVDALNVTSVEMIVPVAAYDLGRLALPVALRFAQAGEPFVAIGGEPAALDAGELIYADQQQVICRDFNYRDADATKITDATADVLLIVDGCGPVSVDEVQETLDLAASRVIRYAGGALEQTAVLYGGG